jgi:hypothetical protein
LWPRVRVLPPPKRFSPRRTPTVEKGPPNHVERYS